MVYHVSNGSSGTTLIGAHLRHSPDHPPGEYRWSHLEALAATGRALPLLQAVRAILTHQVVAFFTFYCIASELEADRAVQVVMGLSHDVTRVLFYHK